MTTQHTRASLAVTLLLIAVVAAPGAREATAEAWLTLGTATGAAGSTVTVPITLARGGTTVCATSFDISFNPTFATFVDASLGPAGASAGKQVAYSTPAFGVARIGVYGANQTPLGDGVVASVRFAITAKASGASSLAGKCGTADCAGNDLGTSCGAGSIVVAGSCALACSTSVPTAGQAGVAVVFSVTATSTGCSGTPAFAWSFGDSATSSQQNPTHVYGAAGTYPWKVVVTVDGQRCEKQGSILISSGPSYPHTYVVPSVAHAPGVGSTQWRSDIAAVNRTTASASLWVEYYATGVQLARTATLAAGATVEWRDVLVGLLGLSASAQSSGTLHVRSSLPLLITSRTYNQAASGTYGQYYPALEVGHAIPPGRLGVLPQLKKSSSFRTNVGVVNLGASACSVSIRLFGTGGAQLGTASLLAVNPGRWLQQNDIFAACGASSQDVVYATVEVQPPGGQVWAYASVVDNATGDPTTIPVLVSGDEASSSTDLPTSSPRLTAVHEVLPREVLTGRRIAAPAQNAQNPSSQANRIILSDGFEGPFPGAWQLWRSEDSTDTTWGDTSQRASSGSFSAWCAAGGSEASFPGDDYASDMNTWMIHGPFSLAGSSSAGATFDYWLKSEEQWSAGQSTYGDPFKWLISVNGTDFYGYRTSGDKGDEFIPVSFDFASVTSITALGSPQVWLAFVFQSDGSLQYEGAYVDDVEITASGAACTLGCTANVPTSGSAGSAVTFAATASPVGCSGSPTFDWDYGDSSSHGTQASATHIPERGELHLDAAGLGRRTDL